MTPDLHAATLPAARTVATLLSDATEGIAGRGALVLLLLAATSAAWWVARRRAAGFRPVRPARSVRPRGADDPIPAHGDAAGDALTAAQLGAELGSRATFVQFSAETCSSCPQVRRVLTALASTEAGVNHVEVASEDRMDLVRRFSVFRTPTVLLLDAAGHVSTRASGPLTADRALAALTQLALPSSRSNHV